MITFILLTSLILWFLFWLNKPKEPSGVVLYFANVGTGKTTFLAKLAQKELKRIAKGKSRYKHVVSNAHISGTRYIDNFRKITKSGAFQDTLILIDEGSIDYNNRKMNLTELEITFMKLVRHYRCTIVVVSQSYNDIDVTLRRLYTDIYLLNYLPLFTLIRPIKKFVGIDEVSNDIVDKYKFKIPFSWRLFCRPLYFKYFDSWWIPSDINIHDLQEFRITEYQKKASRFSFIKDKQVLEALKEEPEEQEEQKEVVASGDSHAQDTDTENIYLKYLK